MKTIGEETKNVLNLKVRDYGALKLRLPDPVDRSSPIRIGLTRGRRQISSSKRL
jgi:hypothetical protein